MKLSKSILIAMILSLALILGACGGKVDESFRNIKWGMTMEEVIAIEEKSGNSDFETRESRILDSDVLEYESIIVNGHKAYLDYYFKNETDGYNLIHRENYLPEKMFDEYKVAMVSDSSKDELEEKWMNFNEKYDIEIKKFDEFYAENEIVKFSDYVLTESTYSFENLDEEDIKEIKASLITKYGKPNLGDEEDDFHFWYLDTIELYYIEDIEDGEVSISYSANYKALEHKMKKNKSNSSGL